MARKAPTLVPRAPEPPEHLEVRQVRLSTLTPDPHNVRLHPEKNLKAIQDSLAAFGQQKPVIVDAHGTILAGNGAYLAAKRLGWEWLTVQVSQLTPDQARAYALADNRTGELSLWDDAALAELLRDLSARELPLPGWDEAELRRLCDAGEMLDVEPELDRAQELREQYGVEVGQLWHCGRHLVMCGDCTNEQVVKQVLAGMVPRLMVTDPPYGVEYEPEWRNDAAQAGATSMGRGAPGGRAVGRVPNDDRADWSAAWRLFPGAVCYVWHGALKVAEVHASLLGCGFIPRAQIVWNKSHHGISRGHYHWQHEPCFYAVRKGQSASWCGDRTQSTIWDIPKAQANETGHSTQKPLECMARPIRNHDAPAVYDPFLGSGTTLVACENLSRRCVALDIDPAYVAVALHRWATLTGETPTREG